ncbi:MAG: T9SS type A sorting domain-containing protein [Bacteroidales bacterium]|nr:T9SS type A sorting domain-containing protein [Bacteroidales bacterium]
MKEMSCRATAMLRNKHSDEIIFEQINTRKQIKKVLNYKFNSLTKVVLGLFLFVFSLSIARAATYYSKGNLSAQTPSNWNTVRAGTGTNATNFTSGDIFVVQNTHTMTASAVWSVSGVGSVVQIESGGKLVASAQITLSANTQFQINNGSTYNHNTSTTTVWGGSETIGATSTVNYGYAGDQTVVALTYGNLILSGSGVKTLTGITVTTLLSMEGSATAMGNPTYGATSQLRYKGSVAQITGSEFPASWTGSGGVLIENSQGVTLGATKNINATTFTIGSLVTNSIFYDGGFQLSGTGRINLTSGKFILGSVTSGTTWPSFTTNSISSGTTVEYASGVSQIVSCSPQYRYLDFSGAGDKIIGTGTLRVIMNWNINGGAAVLNSYNPAVVAGNIIGTGDMIAGSGSITITAHFTNTGNFSAGTSEVLYTSASINQKVKSCTYYNLTFSNTGIKTFLSTVEVLNNLSLLTNATVIVDQYFLTGNPTGTFTMETGAVLSLGSTLSTNEVSMPTFANYTLNNGSTIIYQADAAQTIKNLNYKNLTIGGGASGDAKLLEADLTMNNTLTLASGGSIQLDDYNLTIAQTGTIAGSFSSSNMIICNANGRFIKQATTVNDLVMTYPVGTPGKYTPMQISGTVGGSGSGSLSVAPITGIHPSADPTLVSLAKYWNVATTGITLNAGVASFTFHGSEPSVDPSVLLSYTYQGGSWLMPASTCTGSTISVDLASVPGMTVAGDWTATSRATLYTYRTGDWHNDTTWTTDPSGTEWVNGRTPQSGDRIVINNGYTVTLDANVTTSANTLDVEQGSVLDMGTNLFIQTIAGLEGQGTIKSSSVSGGVAHFPTVTTNYFIAAGGGTYEYDCASSMILPNQATYNNLKINIAVGTTATLVNDITLNGNLTINQGTLQINDATDARLLNLTIYGDITIDAGAALRTGTGHTFATTPVGGGYHSNTHQLYLHGNLTNNGTVRFTNLANPIFNAFPINDALSGGVTVRFTGAANRMAVCNGVTDFYNFIVDKGTDQTYILELTASSTANFTLFGRNELSWDETTPPYTATNPEMKKALWIKNGTLKLTGKISIPSLTEATASRGDYMIPQNAMLWIASPDVSVSTTAVTGDVVATGVRDASGVQALIPSGTFKITDGTFTTRNSAGIVYGYGAISQFIIEGGTINCSQVRESGVAAGKMSYLQSGGTINVGGSAVGEVNNGKPIFGIENSNYTFTFSGGTINLTAPTTNTGTSGNGFYVASGEGNYDVSGGTLNIQINGGSTLNINSTPNLWNLNISRLNASGTSTVNLLKDVTIASDLTIGNNCDFDPTATNYNVTIGGNLTIGSTTGSTTARFVPRNNTTTFNGSSNSTILVSSNNTSYYFSPYDLVIDKNSSSTRVTLAYRSGTSATVGNVLRNFTITRGIFDYDIYTLEVKGNLDNSGIMGAWNKAGRIKLNNTSAIQTITAGIDAGILFGHIEAAHTDNSANDVKLASNVSCDLFTLTSGRVDLKNYLLSIDTNFVTFAVAGTTNHRMFYTMADHANKGMQLKMTKNYTTAATVTYPIGIYDGTTYRWEKVDIGIASTAGNVNGYLQVTVVPLLHPTTNSGGCGVLMGYWKVQKIGLTTPANSITYSFTTEFPYDGAAGTQKKKFLSNGVWNDNGNASGGSPGVNTLSAPTLAGFRNLDFTTSKNACFNNVNYVYSNGTGGGAWNAGASWQGGAVPSVFDYAIIRNGDVITANSNADDAGTVTILQGGTLDVGTVTGLSYGIISGAGKFRISSAAGTPTLPAGDFDPFLTNDTATFEYTGPAYTLPNTITNYPNLLITANANDVTKTLPDATITVRKNLSIADAARTGNTLKVSGSNNLTVNGRLQMRNAAKLVFPAVGSNRTYTIKETIDLRYGNTDNNNIIEIETSASSTLAHTLNFYGDSIIVGNSDINLWKTGNSVVNLNFLGDNSTYITQPRGSNILDFNQITINKDLLSDTVSFKTPITLNAAANTATKPLTLTNGTCVLDASSNNLVLSSGLYDYRIPSTTALILKQGKCSITATGGTYKGLYLDGTLKLEGTSEFIIGDTTSTTEGHYIEYSSSGSARIDVLGSALLSVNAQIRRSLTNVSGILTFNQEGGKVRIHGIAADNGRAKFEILNTGSSFTQSGGVFTLVRGGNSSVYADFYFRPASSNTTAGVIECKPNEVCVDPQTFYVDATQPLKDMYVQGNDLGGTATAMVNVSNLYLNGDLNINANATFNTNNLNLYLEGSFVNNGTFNVGTVDTITFHGNTQTLSGNTLHPTVFNNMVVNNSASLTLQANSNITINNKLQILSGIFDDGGNTVTVKGDIENNTSHVSSVAGAGGIKLNSIHIQNISGDGSGAVFGRLELDNAAGVKLFEDVSITNRLMLTNGALNIDDHLLTIAPTASMPTPVGGFGVNRMIFTNGFYTTARGLSMSLTTSPSTTLFPVGTIGKYTPVAIEATSGTNTQVVNVSPINAYHPTALDATNVLQYYWNITSNLLTNFKGNIYCYYKDNDVAVNGYTESEYYSARLFNNTWTKLPETYVDHDNDIITYPFLSNSNTITGEYTAGIDAALPANVPVYYSNPTGVAPYYWDNPANWSPVPASVPSGAIFVINPTHTITIRNASTISYKTTINGRVDINTGIVGHSFGAVDGVGTLAVSSNNTSIKLPAGRYDEFFSCSGGTLEYGGTGNYTLSNIPTTMRSLVLKGAGVKTLPNKNFTVCELLDIQDGTLDNSINNRTLYINGAINRVVAAVFKSGSGTNAKIVFQGNTSQIIGSFSGTSALNHIEINNDQGLTLNNGVVEMKGNLTFSQGVIHTTSANLLYMSGGLSTTVPAGGSATSYIDGPLKKKITGGYYFEFAVGKDTRWGKAALNQANDGDWTVEYFNTGKTAIPTLTAPLTAASLTEYWSVVGPAGTPQSYVSLRWDDESDVSPLITTNGITAGNAPDMRVAELVTTAWTERLVNSQTTSTNASGFIATTNKITGLDATKYLTVACVNPVVPRARFTNTDTICQGTPISIAFTGSTAYPYTFSYSVNGSDRADKTAISAATYSLATPEPGTYQLNNFTYNGGTGVYNTSTIVVVATPSVADAGTTLNDVNMCGVTDTVLAATDPLIGNGMWSFAPANTGVGGVFEDPAINASRFSGATGQTYKLRWTVSNTCDDSFEDIDVVFHQLPAISFSQQYIDTCIGTTGVIYSTEVGKNNYDWNISGGAITSGGTATDNSATVTWNTPGNGYITVNYDDVHGCSAEFPLLQNMNVLENTISLISTVGTDNQVVGISSPMTNIVYTTTNATGATVSDLPVGASSSWNAGVITISGTPEAYATYTIDLTGGCDLVSVSSTGTITIAEQFYYTQSATNVFDVNNWWSNNDGTGIHPSSLDIDGLTLVINASVTADINSDFEVAEGVVLQVDGTINPAASVVFTGTGTLQGSGVFKVTRTLDEPSFAGQYLVDIIDVSNATVEYAVLAGGQTVTGGLDCNILRLSNTSGVNTANGNVTATTITNTSGGTLNMLTHTLSGAISNTGSTIQFSGASNGRAVASGTIVYNGAAQTIAAGTYSNLTVAAAGDKTLAGVTTVNGVLNLSSGIIKATAANILAISTTGSVVGYSHTSFVSGPVSRTLASTTPTTLIFPVGVNNLMHPVELNVTQATAASTQYVAEYLRVSAWEFPYTLDPGITHTSNQGHWKITKSNANAFSATVKLYYYTSFDIVDETSLDYLTIAKSTVGGTWLNIGGTVTAGSGEGYVLSDAFTSFSEFSLANETGGTNPLPVSLAYFSATHTSKEVSLTWETKSELLNDYFTIEQSVDGVTFTQIAMVNGAGTKSTPTNYSFSHDVTASGIYYYRLKQTDYDGTVTYSEIRAVQVNESFEEIVKTNVLYVFPNPGKTDEITFRFVSPTFGFYNFVVSDMSGRTYASGIIDLQNNYFESKLSEYCKLSAGSYTLHIIGASEVISKKFEVR